MASLSSGIGALSDLDALRADDAGQQLLGLGEAPSGRRLGEYLSRFGAAEVDALLGVVPRLTAQVAPAVIEREVSSWGNVPLFADGTAIEVDGELFEGAAHGYGSEVQYWLHGVFLGGLWASGRLHPGGVDGAQGWREQLDRDIASAIPGGTPVWMRADNAYYRASSSATAPSAAGTT